MSLAERMKNTGFDSDDDLNEGDAPAEEIQSPGVCGAVAAGFMTVAVYLKLNGKDISARKGTYCLGVASCFVVVLITALMLTVMGRLPVVFMRLGELEAGQGDIRLTPGGEAQRARSLSYQKVLNEPAFAPPSDRSYHTPRSRLPGSTNFWPLSACTTSSGQVVNPSDSLAFLWTANPSFNVTTSSTTKASAASDSARCPAKRGCPEEYCDVVSRFQANPFFIDFEREERMGFGRKWPGPVPLRPGECVLEASVAANLGVSVGDHILMVTDAAETLLQAFADAELDDWLEEPYSTWGRIMLPLQVAAIVSESYGKFSTEEERFVLIDFNSALRTMAPFLNPSVSPRKRQLFADGNMTESTNEIYFNFPPDERTDIYAQRDADDVLADATLFATPIIATLGFNQIDADLPVVAYIRQNRFFSLFLGLILSLLIMGLGFLCIVLIHSLLTVGVETRTFELGIMRMVGMTRTMLSGYVLTGALLFAIPAWALGLAVAQLVFLYVQQTLESSLGVEVSPMLTADAIGFATLVGIGMPLVSSIAPIVQVLALDLPAALDTNRSRTQAITYDIRRGGEYHVDWRSFGIGLAMAIAGFLIYYLFPLALITFNITLLFYIFFGILMGMLFGLVLLTTSLEGVVELGVMYVFLWWENDGVFQMIRKNLIAHRLRNRKTTLMFAMSIGFLIFLSVTFNIQIQSVLYQFERWYGGPLNVRGASRENPIDFVTLEAVDRILLDVQATRVPELRWTWGGARYSRQDNLANSSILTVGRYRDVVARVASVAPSYWEVAAQRYFIANMQRDTHWELAESLYSVDGSRRAVLSTAMRDFLSLDTADDAFLISTERFVGNDTAFNRDMTSSAAWLDSSAGFGFSKFEVSLGSYVLLSAPSFLDRARDSMQSIEQLRFDEIIIQCSEASAGLVSDAISAELQRVEKSDQASVRNWLTFRDSLSDAVQVVNYILTFAQIMATFICYFALSSSMSTNIHEQSKEIGVLRCIGFRKSPMTRTYVWEAFVLVCASSLLGVLVGVIMGYTIVLQRALFTQLPLPFVFPWLQLIFVFVQSLFLGLLSSAAPIRAMLATRSQASIIRRAL